MRYPVFRTRHVGSATPGAVVESHQLQFSKNPGPSGPEEIAESHSDFARRKFLPTPRGSPRKWGPGKGDYEHEVLIWSRPRWRFGDFAAVGKVTRRPQAAKSPLRITNQIRNLPPHPSRLRRATFPPRGRLLGGSPLHPPPSGAPSPRGEGFWGEGLKRNEPQ